MFNFKSDNAAIAFPTDTNERREAAERQRLERAAERQKFIAAQSSPQFNPQRRIRLWEQLHAMHLPGDADHSLLGVIAKQTALTLQQVRDEQVRRSAEARGATNPPSHT